MGFAFTNSLLFNDWTISNFFEGAEKSASNWAGYFGLFILAVVMMAGIWFLFKAVTDKQQRGVHVLEALLAFLVAGLIGTKSLTNLNNIKTGVTSSVSKMGNGTKD